MNRRFTDDEIAQFYLRKDKNLGIDRRWNFNPYIHGDKAEYERLIDIANHHKPVYELPLIRQKINDQNAGKVAAGEEIVDKPYDLKEFIDIRGEKQGIQRFPIATGWRPL